LIVRVSKYFAAFPIILVFSTYFDVLLKLFSNLYLSIKFLDTSTKSFFPYRISRIATRDFNLKIDFKIVTFLAYEKGKNKLFV